MNKTLDEKLAVELKSCPFCGSIPYIESNRDWHKLKPTCPDTCIFDGDVDISQVSARPEDRQMMVDDWNTRTPTPDNNKLAVAVKALEALKQIGDEGMKPDYSEWLTTHDKVAQIATEALAAINTPTVQGDEIVNAILPPPINKVEIIKAYRAKWGCTLLEAKNAVDNFFYVQKTSESEHSLNGMFKECTQGDNGELDTTAISKAALALREKHHDIYDKSPLPSHSIQLAATTVTAYLKALNRDKE